MIPSTASATHVGFLLWLWSLVGLAIGTGAGIAAALAIEQR